MIISSPFSKNSSNSISETTQNPIFQKENNNPLKNNEIQNKQNQTLNNQKNQNNLSHNQHRINEFSNSRFCKLTKEEFKKNSFFIRNKFFTIKFKWK